MRAKAFIQVVSTICLFSFSSSIVLEDLRSLKLLVLIAFLQDTAFVLFDLWVIDSRRYFLRGEFFLAIHRKIYISVEEERMLLYDVFMYIAFVFTSSNTEAIQFLNINNGRCMDGVLQFW